MVILADVWKTTPLVAFFLLTRPAVDTRRDLRERARGRRWRGAHVPVDHRALLIPSISIVLILRTIDAFKVFDLVYVLTRAARRTAPRPSPTSPTCRRSPISVSGTARRSPT